MAVNNQEGNAVNMANLVFNAPQLPWRNLKKSIGPYVRSRVWARRMKKSAQGIQLTANNNKPTISNITLALATALGVRYTTTGRGGALEDSPFLLGVSAIPVIPRSLWSTPNAFMPKADILRILDPYFSQIESNMAGVTNGSVVNNVSRMRRNIKNASPNGSNETLLRGAISSFWHPAFTQVMVGNGEWLINGLKFSKAGVMVKAQEVFRSWGDPTQVASLIGSGSKGPQAAEADIAKITITGWPNGTGNFSRTRIHFDFGEDKVGEGEAAGGGGKEVAQMRFIMFATYYLFMHVQIYKRNGANGMAHPWHQIPASNISIDGVFLAAGANTPQNAVLSKQATNTKIRVSGGGEYIPQISKVNLSKFCAIFRLDRSRFATAMTSVNNAFKRRMHTYFSLAAARSGNETTVNNNSMINVPQALRPILPPETFRTPFKPAIYPQPRAVWANKPALVAHEISWLTNLQRLTSSNEGRRTLAAALTAFGAPFNPRMASGPAASSASHQSTPGPGVGAVPFNGKAYEPPNVKTIVNRMLQNGNRPFPEVYKEYMKMVAGPNIRRELESRFTAMRGDPLATRYLQQMRNINKPKPPMASSAKRQAHKVPTQTPNASANKRQKAHEKQSRTARAEGLAIKRGIK